MIITCGGTVKAVGDRVADGIPLCARMERRCFDGFLERGNIILKCCDIFLKRCNIVFQRGNIFGVFFRGLRLIIAFDLIIRAFFDSHPKKDMTNDSIIAQIRKTFAIFFMMIPPENKKCANRS